MTLAGPCLRDFSCDRCRVRQVRQQPEGDTSEGGRFEPRGERIRGAQSRSHCDPRLWLGDWMQEEKLGEGR